MLTWILYLVALSAAIVAGFALGRQERAAERRRRVDHALATFHDYSGSWMLIASARVACPQCGATLQKVAERLRPDAALVKEAVDNLL